MLFLDKLCHFKTYPIPDHIVSKCLSKIKKYQISMMFLQQKSSTLKLQSQHIWLFIMLTPPLILPYPMDFIIYST